MLPKGVESLVRAAARNPYWRSGDAQVVLAAMADSGMPMASFARHFGLSVRKLGRWKRRLPDDEALVPQFHPVQVVVEEGRSDAPHLELVLRNGRKVRVPADFDEATLDRLVRLVESWPC